VFNTGQPEVNNAFAQAREHRAHRNPQTELKVVATETMRQAKLLYQLAQAEGSPYNARLSMYSDV
jgi:hypothetical protein